MINKNRLWFMVALLVIGVGLVVWRLVSIQILQGEEWARRAEAVHQRRVSVPPERGNIYDRNGKVLAFNRAAYSVAVDSYNMTKPELLIDILRDELTISRSELESQVYRQSYFTWIDRSVSYETGQRIKRRIEEENLEGVILLDSSRRVYPHRNLAGPIVGFTGIDGDGLEGVELAMNESLAGEPEIQRIIYGAGREPYRKITLQEGRPGLDLHLTLDLKIQHILQKELERGVDRFEANSGWGVVMDPQTGAVLGMAQDLQYDPNQYGSYQPEERRNKVVADTFEPGSILKVFSGLAALDFGVVDPETQVDGDSPIVIHNHSISNARYRDYGTVPFSDVIKHSINTGIIRVAQDLGERSLYNFLNRVGFGKKTGIELPGEESGTLNHFSRWSGLSIGSVPIGQEVSVTALQLSAKMASVANGGNLVRPTIVQRDDGSDGQTSEGLTQSVSRNRFLASKESVDQMKEMLFSVVEEGTGQQAAMPGVEVAGKTGTAQKAQEGGYATDKYISSFAGFFPKEEPEFLVLIVLDEVGEGPVWGGDTAGAVFRNVGSRIIQSEGL